MIYEKAYAKINLGLQVIDKRSDGYHNLRMIMASINLHDDLFFSEYDSILLECDKNINNEENLVFKVAKLIIEKYNIKQGAKISIKKKIKIGAGLAGGSSDAAAAIRGLNKLWNLNLNYIDMVRLALEIGSDVPFCISGKLSIAEGRGEILRHLTIPLKAYIVLVMPNYSLFTKDVFSNYKQGLSDNKRYENLEQAIISNNLNNIGKNLFNDLEESANKIITNCINNAILISEIKKEFDKTDCCGAVMSGSGSTVYGIYDNYEKAYEATNKFTNIYPDYTILLTETIQK